MISEIAVGVMASLAGKNGEVRSTQKANSGPWKTCQVDFQLSTLSLVVSRRLIAMAIQKEPGQKGVNWSNIAVGMRNFVLLTRDVWRHPTAGAIMNMVHIILHLWFQLISSS